MNALIDPASPFLELSAMAGHEVYPDPLPGAGLVTGIGGLLREDDRSALTGYRYGRWTEMHDRGQ